MVNLNLHKRRSIRLQDYDYSQPGEYFVTICTCNHEYMFGEIVDEEIRLNELGKIVQEEWSRTAEIRENVELDSFIVMPNHIHGIIVLTEPGRGTLRRALVGANCHSPQNCHSSQAKSHNNSSNNGAYIDTPLQKTKFCSSSGTIGAIIRGFKSAATKRINELHSTPGIPVWQRNYYEHIIRDDKELDNIREYIANNPLKWLLEKEIPDNFMGTLT
ncbi:MAG: transposase [Bacteroidota bacterium]